MSEMNVLADIVSRGGGTVTGTIKGEEVAGEILEGKPAKIEPKVETKVETKTAPAAETKTDTNFDIGSFNKKFSKEFDEETLLNHVEKGSKYDEIESQFNDLKQRYTELETVAKKGTNPLEWFASEDEYIRQQFLKNKAGQYGEDSVKILSKLTPSSIDKLNAWEALKTDMLINNPELEGGMDAVEELLMERYSVDSNNFDEFETKTKNLIKLDAKNAKTNLKGLYADIEVPKAVNFEESRKQLSETWNTPLKQIVEGLDKIKVAEGLDFAVTSEMKDGIEEELMSDILSGQIKPSKDAAGELVARARTKILLDNFDKVVEHIVKTKEVEIRERIRAEVENRVPLNNEAKPGETNNIAGAVSWLTK